ncbi:MAG: NifB/NifX family molybdenum-iron cluster-binding protein [Candidatus Hydrothermia bacterium]
MKIAIASDDGKTLSMHFGRALGFVIVEVEGNEVKSVKYIPNTITPHSRGEHKEHGEHHGHHHDYILENLKDVEVVIAGGMGRRLFEDLKAAGKKVFVTDEEDVMEAVDLFLKGELKNLDELLH